MTDTRQDILQYLREKGAADVNELAGALGLSPEHATNLQGKPLEQKIDTLIELLGEEGFMSRLEKVGADDFVLTQVNCPYQYVATRHPEVCELDLQLMNTALGTAVQRDSCVANGDSVCTFHIKSQPIQLQA